jgi:elongation factor G
VAAARDVPAGKVRNVVLVGHGGTGKTTLATTMLAAAGCGGALDAEPEERERGHSLSTAAASLNWRDHKINVLDTPGSTEAVGDAYPALLAADLAIFVVDAELGIQPQHDDLWGACAGLRMPRLVFLNKLDKREATFQANVDALQERVGNQMAPVWMPLGVGEQFTGVIDLLTQRAVEKRDGEKVEGPVPQARAEQAAGNRQLLVEAIVENDDDLLERYLEGDVPSSEELAAVFARGIAECGFFPVLCGSALEDVGVRLLLDFLVDQAPAPQAGDGGTAVYVAKTVSDPYVGRINVMRVLSGEVRQDDELRDARTGASVRLHQLMRYEGTQSKPATHFGTGDLFACAKLEDVRTTDVLTTAGSAVTLPAVPLPEPYHRVALEPASRGDEDKLSSALARLTEEDPALRVVRDAETAQLVLTTYGASHLDVTLARMRRKFNATVRQVPLRLRYRETLAGPGTGLGRHVKQSGGHGQYGIATVEVEPLPPGSGFEFVDRIVGGVVPRQFIGSVEKGVREAMSSGVLGGYPVVDVRVTLVDGKHHSVDSSDMAFQMAGILAFRAAAEKAGAVLLEPVMEIEASAPDAYVGDLMGDLSGRRGRIQGTDQVLQGRTTIRATVPESELLDYVAALRSLTSGTGTVRMRYSHHDPVPEHITRRVLAAAAE